MSARFASIRIPAIPKTLWFTLLLGVAAFASHPLPAKADPADDGAQQIAERLNDGGSTITVLGQALESRPLRAFYAGRDWQPAWTEAAAEIQGILATGREDGLSTVPFHLDTIAAAEKKGDPADADLLLTDAILRYATAMKGVRVNPQRFEGDWFLPAPKFDPSQFIAAHVSDMPDALLDLEPVADGYQGLKWALARLHAVAAVGGWPTVPTSGAPLHPGDSDPRILAVRRRLQATGELSSDAPESPVFDDTLVAAVKLFQSRNGQTPDGQLGPRTIAAMNVSAAQRADRVALNMERWRWLPPTLEAEHIAVNVPDQSMELFEDGKPAMGMRVVVGDVNHPTPAMHVEMTSIMFNPDWRIPQDIATAEILPKLKQDASYLQENDLVLVSGDFPPGSPESQGAGIDWSKMNAMPWPVRQLPGSDNALGRIKFNMPNDDDIYLHDTPERQLFAQQVRAFSHGCVRLQNPEALALFLLQTKGWDESRIDQEIGTGETHTVQLSRHIPVWLLYFTAWVDPDGTVEYRNDLYGRDHRLSEALTHPNAPPPRPQAETVKYCDGCRLP